MANIIVDSDSVAALDAILCSICPIEAEWSVVLGQHMRMITQDFGSTCFENTDGVGIADSAEAYLLRCTEAFQNFILNERVKRVQFVALHASYYIKEGILTVEQVKSAVQDLADRREELALGGVHPLDSVSEAESAEFAKCLDAALRYEVVKSAA